MDVRQRLVRAGVVAALIIVQTTISDTTLRWTACWNLVSKKNRVVDDARGMVDFTDYITASVDGHRVLTVSLGTYQPALVQLPLP